MYVARGKPPTGCADNEYLWNSYHTMFQWQAFQLSRIMARGYSNITSCRRHNKSGREKIVQEFRWLWSSIVYTITEVWRQSKSLQNSFTDLISSSDTSKCRKSTVSLDAIFHKLLQVKHWSQGDLEAAVCAEGQRKAGWSDRPIISLILCFIISIYVFLWDFMFASTNRKLARSAIASALGCNNWFVTILLFLEIFIIKCLVIYTDRACLLFTRKQMFVRDTQGILLPILNGKRPLFWRDWCCIHDIWIEQQRWKFSHSVFMASDSWRRLNNYTADNVRVKTSVNWLCTALNLLNCSLITVSTRLFFSCLHLH